MKMTIQKMKQLNRDKLPLKYILNVYKEYENYPTNEDIIFELASDEEILNGKIFDINYLKYILSFKFQKDEIKNRLNKLIELGYLEINTENNASFYKLVFHNWQ